MHSYRDLSNTCIQSLIQTRAVFQVLYRRAIPCNKHNPSQTLDIFLIIARLKKINFYYIKFISIKCYMYAFNRYYTRSYCQVIIYSLLVISLLSLVFYGFFVKQRIFQIISIQVPSYYVKRRL